MPSLHRHGSKPWLLVALDLKHDLTLTLDVILTCLRLNPNFVCGACNLVP